MSLQGSSGTTAALEALAARESPNARGEATRERIIVAAERLFAEQGIDAVPLRDIGLAAGQKNSVAVQYHFGDRENLIRAVASHRAAFVEQIQVELLAELETTGRPPRATDHVRAFVVSLARNVSEDNHYVPFLSRYMVERGGYGGLELSVPSDTVAGLTRLLRSSLPDLPDPVIDRRWEIVMTTTVNTLGRYQMALHADRLDAPLDELVDDLARFLAVGLAAPLDLD
ncbi:MAG TPA: TetR family transcriptional regulator [Acidimicrobiales bacterium]